MAISHIFLVLVVVLIWGINFVFVKLGLNEISPLTLCAMRFILASVPAVFFVKRPAAPFKIIALYGLVMFALQFTFVFLGMHAGMTPGMASIIMQVQVFFSMFFAAALLDETIYSWQMIGALISFSGIILVGMHCDNHISFWGFILLLAAAATWGVGNLITKKITNTNMISLVIWGSFVASFPIVGLALVFEGPSHIIYSYQHVTWVGITSLLYIAYISTWVGYGIWGWLVTRYPVSIVVPFTLLIPIVGVLSSIIILNEPFQLWKLIAGLLVIGGLGVNLFGVRIFYAKTKVKDKIK